MIYDWYLLIVVYWKSQDRSKHEPRLIQIETKQCHEKPQFILCPNPKWTGPSHTQVDRPGVFQGQTLAADSGKQKQETPQAWLGSVLINYLDLPSERA